MSDIVEVLGHRVVAEAGNLPDGQALAETAIFDLAIVDINLGGESIEPVAETIDKRGLPFLFLSGYNSDSRPTAFAHRPALIKPATLSQLGAAIQTILSRSGS